MAIVNQEDSPLAAASDAVIPLHAGPERSVAATKSCLTSAIALVALVAAWRGDTGLQAAIASLPAVFDATLREDWDAALPILREAPSAYVVGRGPAFPVAAEAALKLKETAVLHAEAFSGAEVMHGPLQLLHPGFPVVAFSQNDASRAAMKDSIARLRGAQGRVFEVSTEGAGADVLRVVPTGHAALDPLAMLLGFYALAEKVARARGHDPDRPSLLRKVTETI